MHDVDLWDKFYEIAWKAVKESPCTDEYNEDGFSCYTTEAFYRTAEYGYFFECKKVNDNRFEDYERFYSNVRVLAHSDWETVRTEFVEVWDALIEEFPEFRALDVLYV